MTPPWSVRCSTVKRRRRRCCIVRVGDVDDSTEAGLQQLVRGGTAAEDGQELVEQGRRKLHQRFRARLGELGRCLTRRTIEVPSQPEV